jgi:4-diphosphocytidyl-2-C-methyl-D-erythritol kinase
MRVLLFKPAFAVPTPWAYARLAAGAPRGYVRPERAEALLAAWVQKPGAPAWDLHLNSFEGPVFAKFGALPILAGRLRERFGIEARMTGSGSACFALVNENVDAAAVAAAVREAWGASAFFVETRVA